MAQVRLSNITKRFGTIVAVKQIDLSVNDTEFLVLVGPSGCGKTTTLRMVAGLEEVTEGEIYIGERKVNQVPSKDRDVA
jgi:multiple sugar transport system ATP-binding protein